ncbi:MAG: hypothetical protein WC342_08975 [Methanoregula sp.]|jgi:hypothetical protein
MKKKYLTFAGIIAALILAGMFIGISIYSSPFPLPSPAITIDPITDANIDGNNIMSLTGTTTLPTNATILIAVNASIPSMSQENATGTQGVRGFATFLAEVHRWKGAVNISPLQPGDYTITLLICTLDENFKINGTHSVATQHFTLGDENAGAGSIHKKKSGAPQPFIRINPAHQKSTMGNLEISGITSLAPGTLLSWSMHSVSGGTGNNPQGYQGTTMVIPGIDRVNRWSVLPGADTTKPARYRFDIGANLPGNIPPAGTVSALAEFDIPQNYTGHQNSSGTMQVPPGFITIDTLPDMRVNNAYVITGTTSLPAGEHIQVNVYPASFETGFDFSVDARDASQNCSLSSGAVFSGATGTVDVVNGTDGDNLWSFSLGTYQMNPGQYLINASNHRLDSSGNALVYGDLFDTKIFPISGDTL